MASELTPWQQSQGLGDDEPVGEVKSPAAADPARKKRTRKKPEELPMFTSDPPTTPRTTTDWSLGFTIVDN